ncbi:MAG TPA: ribonuclease HI family protein [Patescibacteria group bacterium]|nr:ribonuclease HI family protein [Patescibacteria group bacterium]
MEKQLVIHTDGGSRGNPGPAACAFVAEENGVEIFKASKYLAAKTNNFAEYSGVILALKWLEEKAIQTSQVTFYLDSELVVKQINGIYKVKDENLRNLFFEILTLIKKLGNSFVFKNVPREKNKEADLLVNLELDKSH